MNDNKDRYNKECHNDTDSDKMIFDINYDEYAEEKKYSKSSFNNEENKKKELKMHVNCNLKVEFDSKNKMIYLHPGKSEFIEICVSKCCRNITVKYNGCYPNYGIYGNLARYKIAQSGIIIETYQKLDPKKKDYLCFTAIDECTHEYCEFIVVFTCDIFDYLN